jgi:hypothetical protein
VQKNKRPMSPEPTESIANKKVKNENENECNK